MPRCFRTALILTAAAAFLAAVPVSGWAKCIQGDCKNGEGVYRWPNGAEYAGHFTGGSFDGQGRYKWPNGAMYEGQWVKDKKSGFGKYSWPDGKSYEGGWKEDVKHGVGTYKWPDGKSYVGGFRDNLRDGYGTYSWPNGARYEGEWEQGKKHGAGIYTFPDGQQTAGTWEAGEQSATQEVADVETYLQTLRDEQTKAMAAMKAEAAPPPPAAVAPAAAVPAAAASGPSETPAASEPETTSTTAAAPPASAPAAAPAPVAAAYRLSVANTPVVLDSPEAGAHKIALYTGSDHVTVGSLDLRVKKSGSSDDYQVNLTVENKSKCRLHFDGLIGLDGTYYRVVSWTGDGAVSPGDSKSESKSLNIKTDLFGPSMFFKSQGYSTDCTQ